MKKKYLILKIVFPTAKPKSATFIDNTEGSLTLEASIVLPLFLLYIGLLMAMLLSVQADILWQEAARSAIEEAELSSALLLDHAYNTEKSFLSLKEQGIDFLLDQFNVHFIGRRQRHYFTHNPSYTPYLDLFIQYEIAYIERSENNVLEYHFSYEVPFHIEDKLRTYSYPLPYWGGYSLETVDKLKEQLEKDDKEADSKAWDLPQLNRGRYFQENRGRNLPSSYPVLTSFNNGEAKCIKSIDLTAPTYSDDEKLLKKIDSFARDLENFQGTRDWGKDKISIHPSMIKTRVLEVVVPENASASQLDLLEKQKTILAGRGIDFRLVQSGVSRSYQNPDE